MTDRAQTLELLSRSMRKLRAAYDKEAQHHGLTLARVQVLMALVRHEGVTQAELSELLIMEAPSIKAQIDALVADGFAERRADPTDHRKKTLHITPQGRLGPIMTFITATRERLFDGVEAEDLEVLNRVLNRFNDNIARLDSK